MGTYILGFLFLCSEFGYKNEWTGQETGQPKTTEPSGAHQNTISHQLLFEFRVWWQVIQGKMCSRKVIRPETR